MVYRRLDWYLENKSIFLNIQSGFRKERSSTDNIILLENSIQQSLGNLLFRYNQGI